jgi:hypothetical protein
MACWREAITIKIRDVLNGIVTVQSKVAYRLLGYDWKSFRSFFVLSLLLSKE